MVGDSAADLVAGREPGPVGSWLVEGIGEDFVPPNCDLDAVDQAITIDDREALHTARALLAEEGLLGGSSTGNWERIASKPFDEETNVGKLRELIPTAIWNFIAQSARGARTYRALVALVMNQR